MIECTAWNAWYSSRGRGGTMLHVMGECRGTYAEAQLLLRPHRVPAPGDVFVRGPGSIDPAAPPPTFDVTVPAGRWYAIETTPDLRLFDPARRRLRRNATFFASWSTGLLTAPQFSLSRPAWDSFRTGERLFYRILTTARPDAWDGAEVWPAQFADAPFIRIGPPAIDARTLNLVVAFRDAVTPVEVPEAPLTLRLDRPSDEIYDTVAILTSAVDIPIDVAR